MIKKVHTSEDSGKRKSYKILNLSQLLNKKIVPSPEIIMQARMSTSGQKRNKEYQKNDDKDQNQTNPNQRIPLKINYQHYRSKSSTQIKSYYDSIKSPYQHQKNIGNLSDSRNRNIFIDSNRHNDSPHVKGLSLENSYKSQQISSSNSFKNQNYAFRQELYAAQKNKHNEAMLIMSLQYKRNFQTMSSMEHANESKQKSKKKFLRKRSSLQKQIVVNLLKNKIIKEHEENIKKQYTEHDILSMVKLYKGFLSFPNSPIKNPEIISKAKVNSNLKSKVHKQNEKITNQQFLRSYQSLPEKIVEKYPKPIIGWQTEPQFAIYQHKNDQNTQITMDNSYGLP